MRIGISGYVGSIKTGIGRSLENIVKQWREDKNGHLFYLFCNKDNSDFDRFLNNGKIVEKRIGISKKSPLLNLLWHQWVAQVRVFFNKFDLFYIPNVTLLAWKACPTVVVINDLIEFNVPDKFDRLRMIYRKIAVPITARRANKIITITEHSKKDIIKYLKIDPDKIEVIYCGFDERFKPASPRDVNRVKEKYGLSENYILYVGTIDHPGKNCYNLINAFDIFLRNNNPDYELVLVGGKGYGFDKVLKLVRELKLESKVKFPGYVSDDDLPAVYTGARVFAFLSLYEGFGLPVIEAMACGTPVIISNRSSLPEIAGEAACRAEPGDVPEISRLLNALISDKKLREEKIAQGYRQIGKFSWQRAAEQTLAVFRDVLKENKKETKRKGKEKKGKGKKK